jgi:hypothetical protein
MKAQGGGMMEWVSSYSKLFIFGILITIILLMMFLVYINSYPELGITIPDIFGG